MQARTGARAFPNAKSLDERKGKKGERRCAERNEKKGKEKEGAKGRKKWRGKLQGQSRNETV